MISEISLQNPELVAAIHALGREAYAVEAGLIGCADFPPLRETVGQLGASRDRFLVFEIRTDSGTGVSPVRTGTHGRDARATTQAASEIVAVFSFCVEGNDIAIHRLCVSPKQFRRGMTRTLLTRLEGLGASSIVVSTAQLNLPAMELYRNLGYTLTGTNLSPESIALAHFRKVVETITNRR